MLIQTHPLHVAIIISVQRFFRLDDIGHEGCGEMEFVKVASASEVPAGKMKMVKVGETEVLIANVGGKYYAISNRCTHAGGSLSEGSLEGNVVTCPKHGSKFDLTSGKAVQGPKIAFFKLKTKDEQTFEVKADGPDILVKTA